MSCPMVLNQIVMSTSILCFTISNFVFFGGEGVANELGRGTSIQNSCIDNSGNIYINQILAQRTIVRVQLW